MDSPRQMCNSCTFCFRNMDLRRFAAVSMNFQNLYDFAQIWQRHSLIHFLSEHAKKIGGHDVGFQDGADQSSLDYTRIFDQVFSIISDGWKAMTL